MAVYRSDQVANNGPRSVHGDAREAQHSVTYTNVTAPLLLNDTIQLGYLPPNAVIASTAVGATQLDTNGTPTLAFNIGDGGFGVSGQTGYVAADPQRYFSATTVGRGANGSDANTTAVFNGRARFFKNTSGANLLIYATVSAAPATGATGTITWLVTYFIDEPQSLLNQ